MKKYIGFVLLFCTMMVSCSNYYQVHQELLKIKKGMNSAEVIKLIDDNPGANIYDYDENQVREAKVANSANKYSIIIGSKKIMVFPIKQKYLYAFENDKLMFWGTPLEFARNSSPLINQLGEEGVRLFDVYENE